jgi:hypothetical protein
LYTNHTFEELEKIVDALPTEVILAIAELGELYKKRLESTPDEGDLAWYIAENISPLVTFWYAKGEEDATPLNEVIKKWELSLADVDENK